MNQMIKFGTGGWRAIIGDEFTKSNIQLLAQGLTDKMQAEGVADKGIVMGYDRRFLSKEAMQWAGVVFATAGIKAYLINQSGPTPLIMYYVMQHEFPYGMMITASHNPAVYNGVKVFTYGGRDADETQTQEIEHYIEKILMGHAVDSIETHREMYNDPNGQLEKYIDYDAAKRQGLIEEIYPLNEYLDNILAAIDVNAIRQASFRIAIDPMYGVSETSLTMIFHTARCEVVTINERHDTLFGGKLPSPSAATLHALQNCVLDKHCDIGIATDGDADRIGIIDDTGRFLHPNDILVLLYYYLVKYKGWTGPAVRNIATTHMLDRVAEKFGQKCYEVPVGFKHISAKMNEVDAVIGGESSGGLTVRGHIKGKDGIYAAALLVEMMARVGRKLSEINQDIVDECGTIYMEERDYKFSQEKKDAIQQMIMADKRLPELPFEVDRVSYLDGCKVYFVNSGWVVCRFSGTEPLLRIFCEMPEVEDAKMVCALYEEFLEL